MSDLSSIYADRASLGTTDALVPSSPLRLGTLATPAVGASRLALDANGNVTAGVLVAGDIPSVFTRRDVAETIDESWTWAPGKSVVFSPTSNAPPSLTGRSIGTRVVLHPHTGGTTEYAIGIENGASWISVPPTGVHKWYSGATERLRLDSDGTVKVLNGTGGIYLASAATGDGALVAQSSLQVRAGTGGITLQTGERRIVPATGYTENLGELTRKFLSLHAAELWVETLVAQSTLATIGGRILVGPTTTLTRDITASDVTIYVKHNSLGLQVPTVVVGSCLLLEVAGKFEVMLVQSTTTPPLVGGEYMYSVTRGWGGTAAAWTAGDAVFDTGRAPSSAGPAGAFIDLYSVRGVNPGSSAGPTIVGNLRTGSLATEWREYWAIGNLKGIYGIGSDRFGAAFGDTNAMHVQIDATDGIQFLGGGGSTGFKYAHLDMSGNLSLGYSTAGQLSFTAADGALRIKMAGSEKFAFLSDGYAYLQTGLVVGNGAASLGVVRSVNATGWTTGSGFYFEATGPTPPSGYAANLTRCLIGNSVGRRLQWDGANLLLASDGFSLDANGIVINTASTQANARTIRFEPNGAVLWDAGAAGGFTIIRGSGNVMVAASNGDVALSGGASGGLVQSQVIVRSNTVEVLTATGNAFRPIDDATIDLGQAARRWRSFYASNAKILHGLFGGATSFSYYLEVGADYAGKPISSTWTVVSDRAIKTAIEPVDTRDALATVVRVPLVRYRLISTDEPGIGVVAQDVRDLLPLSIRARKTDGLLDWNAHELLILNVAAVQELAARIDALERTQTP